MHVAIPLPKHYPKVMFTSSAITCGSFQKLPLGSNLVEVDIKETRRQALIHLIEKRFGGSQKKLADAIGRADNYISNIVNRRKNIGEDVARDIENQLQLPRYFLDTDPTEGGADAAELLRLKETTARYDARAAPESVDSIKRSRELARIARLTQFATAADLSKMADAMEQVLIEDRQSRENAESQLKKTAT